MTSAPVLNIPTTTTLIISEAQFHLCCNRRESRHNVIWHQQYAISAHNCANQDQSSSIQYHIRYQLHCRNIPPQQPTYTFNQLLHSINNRFYPLTHHSSIVTAQSPHPFPVYESPNYIPFTSIGPHHTIDKSINHHYTEYKSVSVVYRM